MTVCAITATGSTAVCDITQLRCTLPITGNNIFVHLMDCWGVAGLLHPCGPQCALTKSWTKIVCICCNGPSSCGRWVATSSVVSAMSTDGEILIRVYIRSRFQRGVAAYHVTFRGGSASVHPSSRTKTVLRSVCKAALMQDRGYTLLKYLPRVHLVPDS